MSGSCPLCNASGELVIACSDQWRVVRVIDADFPAFYRVIWQRHAGEFSDLSLPERGECMAVVATVEQVLRRLLKPTKINLASLGNLVAHLHWHVIARFDWDSHFPQPIWGSPQRVRAPDMIERLNAELTGIDVVLRDALTLPQAATKTGR